MRIWRKVTTNVEARRGRHTRVRFTLECGHSQARKGSQGVPARARCEECECVRGGGGSTYFDTAKGLKTSQRWDEATQMPVDVVEPMSAEDIAYWIR